MVLPDRLYRPEGRRISKQVIIDAGIFGWDSNRQLKTIAYIQVYDDPWNRKTRPSTLATEKRVSRSSVSLLIVSKTARSFSSMPLDFVTDLVI